MRRILSVVAAILFGAGAANAAVPAPRAISGWVVSQFTPGGGGCTARRVGREVNVSLMINGRDHIVVAVARPDWRLEPGKTVEATLTIDDGAPQTVQVSPMMVLALFEVDSADLEQHMLHGRSMQLRFPWGSFTADLTAANEAVEAVRECNKQP